MTPHFLTPIAESLGSPGIGAAAGMAAKAAVLLALAIVAARLISRAPAARRHLVLSAGIVSSLLLPITGVLVPSWRVALLPPGEPALPVAPATSVSTGWREPGPARVGVALPSASPSAASPAVVAGDVAEPMFATQPASPLAGPDGTPARRVLSIMSPRLAIVLVWLTGVVVVLLPWTVGLLTRRRFARLSSSRLPTEWDDALRAIRQEVTVSSRVRVLACTATPMPMTWGVLRPIVLVPQDVDWTHDERRVALLHEMAHVRRWDSLTQLAARLVCALYWFNPLAWVTARAERLAREEACDDAVLRSGARPSAYAEQLLGVAGSSGLMPLPVAALTMARPSNLAVRLRAILDGRRDRSGAGRRSLRATLAGAALILVPLSAFTPVRQAAGSAQRAWSPATTQQASASKPRRDRRPMATAGVPAPAATSVGAGVNAAASPSAGVGAAVSPSAGANAAASPSAASRVIASPSASGPAMASHSAPSHPIASPAAGGMAMASPSAGGTPLALPSAALPAAATAGGMAWAATSSPAVSAMVEESRPAAGARASDALSLGAQSLVSAMTSSRTQARLTDLVDRARSAAADLLPALVPRQGVGCSRSGKGRSTSHWSSNDDDTPEHRRMQVKWSEGSCRMELDARGAFTFTPNADDIATITEGGYFDLLDGTSEPERRLRIKSGPGGTLTRTYSVDGDRATFDATAAAWFAKALITLDRRTAFAVDARLPQLLQRGGVDAVLAETALMSGDYPQRVYFSKLMARKALTLDELGRVLASASSSMSSDYEKAELLVAVAKQRAFDDGVHLPFARMAGGIKSSYERRRALSTLLMRNDLKPEVVRTVLAATDGMDSDYELAELLLAVSRRYAIDASTRPHYLKAVASLDSDYEHRRVLDALVKGGDLTPSVSVFLLQDAQRIRSDYELAEFLRHVAAAAQFDEPAYNAYLAAAEKISSSYEHHRALSALVERRDTPPFAIRSIVQAARSLDSDYERASLLVEIAGKHDLSGDLLETYLQVAGTLKDYERDRALAAVPRAKTRVKL